MTHATHLPFIHDLIPVCYSLEDLIEFTENFPDFDLCLYLYLAYKNEDTWAENKKRRYMNKIIPKLLFVPVTINPANLDEIRALSVFVEDKTNIIAMDITDKYAHHPSIDDVFRQHTDMAFVYDFLSRQKDGHFVAERVREISELERDYVVLKRLAGMVHHRMPTFGDFRQMAEES
jgi:hypothetical protein